MFKRTASKLLLDESVKSLYSTGLWIKPKASTSLPILLQNTNEELSWCEKNLRNFSSLLRYQKYVIPDASIPSRRYWSSWADSFDSPTSLVMPFSCALLKCIGLFLSGIGGWYDPDVPISSSSVSLFSVTSMSLGTLGTGILGSWCTGFLADRISAYTTRCLFF